MTLGWFEIVALAGGLLLLCNCLYFLSFLTGRKKDFPKRSWVVVEVTQIDCAVSDANYEFTVEGRPEGFLGWLAWALDWGTTLELEISPTAVRASQHSPSQKLDVILPTRNIASCQYGTSHSFSAWLVALIFFLVGFVGLGFGYLTWASIPNRAGDFPAVRPINAAPDPIQPQLGNNAPPLMDFLSRWQVVIPLAILVVSLIFYLYYLFTKRLWLSISSNSGEKIALSFVPGVIDAIEIDHSWVKEMGQTLITLAAIHNPGDFLQKSQKKIISCLQDMSDRLVTHQRNMTTTPSISSEKAGQLSCRKCGKQVVYSPQLTVGTISCPGCGEILRRG